MSVVRGYAEVAADLRTVPDTDATAIRVVDIRLEAAALLAEVAATLPDCPRCGGTGEVRDDERMSPFGGTVGYKKPCPDCLETPGKVSVAQMAATYARVWDPTLDSDPQYPSSGKLAIVGQLRGVW